MKSLITTVVTISTLVTCAPVFANEQPAHFGTWELSITGGFFKPSMTHTQYAVNAMTIIAGPSSGPLLRNRASYRFFGGLNLGYLCYDSNNNFNATYFMGTSKNNSSFSGTVSPTLPPVQYIVIAATSAFSEFKYNYHFANIEIGSLLNNGLNNGLNDCGNLRINPTFGVSYYDVKSDQLVNYYGVNLVAAPAQSAQIGKKSKFEGIGPSLGLNLSYPIGCFGFAIVSNNRYSALFGKMHNEYFGSFINSAGVNEALPFNTIFNNKQDLASLVQSELGIAYEFPWSCDYAGRILLGYQFKFATDTYKEGQFVDEFESSELLIKKGNTGDQGPFLRLSIAF